MAETIKTQTTGYECVGIEKIEQTYEGLYDNKPNIITIYLTNGDTHQFKVMNGSQGVGIDRIEQRQSSTVSGGRNEFAIILTNGKEYTFSTYNGSGGSGSSGSFNQVLQKLNNMLMPSGKSYLYYNGSGFEWKSPDGSTGGGTADLSEYSWWGRKFDPASKMITGEMSAVTSIEFQSTKGETTIRKKLYLDENGDLCFNGNLYATGGITALGSGGGTSGGSGASLGTLLTKLNSENPFPTANGQVLTYNGSNFVWKTPTGSGVALSAVMTKMNEQLGKTTYNTPQFLYWNGTTYTWKNESEISGGSGGSIQVAETPQYSGGSENWVSTTKLRFVGITGTKPSIRTNSEKSCVDVGIPVGSGSGSSGTTSGKLRFYKDSSEESWNGESDFKIIFGSGLNVTWDSHSQITLSATGGSSGGSSGGSVSWENVTGKPSTFTPSSHTHSTSEISGLDSYVKGTKVSNASAADRLANARTIWGQSFNGTDNITGNLKMGSAGGGSIQLWMNGGNILDRTDNTLHIGYGLKESSDGEINLDAYRTVVYTDNSSRHYDFKSNVFDVNTNAIHFGSGASGGKISWDRANNAFKIEGNVYATGGITALGVSNNATTSNNVDFTFGSVTSKRNIIYADDNVPFKIYPKNNTKAALLFSYNGKNWSIRDDNDETLYLQDECYIDSDGWIYSSQFISRENGSMSLDGSSFYLGDTDNNVNVVFTYNGSKYKLDMSKAISVGVFTMFSSTQELSALQKRMTKKKAVL